MADFVLHVDATDNFDEDFTKKLVGAEILTGTPTVKVSRRENGVWVDYSARFGTSGPSNIARDGTNKKVDYTLSPKDAPTAPAVGKYYVYVSCGTDNSRTLTNENDPTVIRVTATPGQA